MIIKNGVEDAFVYMGDEIAEEVVQIQEIVKNSMGDTIEQVQVFTWKESE